MKVLVDNTQALSSAKNGYSKRLRYLQRTHRVSFGVLRDLLEDDTQRISAEYVSTKSQKGDMFTKNLIPAAFGDARTLIGMVP